MKIVLALLALAVCLPATAQSTKGMIEMKPGETRNF